MEIRIPTLCSDGKIRYPRKFISEDHQKNSKCNYLDSSVLKNASQNKNTGEKFSFLEKIRKKSFQKSEPETSSRLVTPLRGSPSRPRWGRDGSLSVPDDISGSPPEKNDSDFEESLKDFEQAWDSLSQEFYGKSIQFFGKRIRNVNKALAAYRAVRNARSLKTDIFLYLRSHFDQAKRSPTVLRPSFLGSNQGIKLYSEWIKKFANKQDARSKICHTDLEELLAEDHKNFLHYKDKMNLTEYGIFTLMYSQFTHLYLITCPSFLDILDRESSRFPSSFVKECRETLKRLRRKPLDAMNLYRLVEKIKCTER